MKKATLGAGCFWHVEEAFRNVKGVIKTTVGYMGGSLKNPSYEDVCTDKTGHVEVCQIEFDQTIISYKKLLDLFWEIHDPTQMNRQGLDIGTQYRSIIFFHDEQQHKIALESKDKEQKKQKKEIVTKIVPAEKFYEAEEYHQKYLLKRGRNTC